jgi:TRAP-type C4-dicarboxylate transport system substrate-binding protein
MIGGKKMKAKVLLMTLIVLTVSSFMAIGSKPTGAAETSPTQKVIKLIVSDHHPDLAPPHQALVYWAQEVEKLCGGRVKLTVYSSSSLLKLNEALNGVQSGIADIAIYFPAEQDGFLLNSVMQLPFMGYTERKASNVYRGLIKSFPQLLKEFQKVRLYNIVFLAPWQIHMTKRIVRTPKDVKGIKIISRMNMVEMMAAAGAVPVDIPPQEWYMALDKKLAEGFINHLQTLTAFGILELLPYHIYLGEAGISVQPFTLIWNDDSWNSLPSDIQKIMADSAYLYEEKFYELSEQDKVRSKGLADKLGHSFTYLTPEEIKLWKDIVKGPVINKWIEKTEAKGLPGKGIYQEALRLIQEQHAK